ncbi:hypothetical protein ABVK25_000590 [Lepraria finkii]|uniref:Uncharacterized protein n=1 Tax=Lepraria finkii TaxID=1340010 RepID=A0ABR4BNJ8_9LECA
MAVRELSQRLSFWQVLDVGGAYVRLLTWKALVWQTRVLLSGAIGGGVLNSWDWEFRRVSSGGGWVRRTPRRQRTNEDIKSEAADLPDRVKRVCGRLKECVMFCSVSHWLIQRAMDELETVERHGRPPGGARLGKAARLDRDLPRLHGGSLQARRECLPMTAGIDTLIFGLKSPVESLIWCPCLSLVRLPRI